MTYRIHILGIPHTVSTEEYSSCAFTAKVVKLCRMLTDEGHEVIHYGHRDSQVPCENVAVTDDAVQKITYGDHDWREKGWPKFATNDHCFQVFYRNTIEQLSSRKRKGDFLFCPFGVGHQPIAIAHPDLVAVEPGIGYPEDFAKFRVFESYAVMHAFQGKSSVKTARNDFWYDAVIPNAFDPMQFNFQRGKQDYLLFLGRLGEGKGAHIAGQVAKKTGYKLVAAGQGDLSIFGDNQDIVDYRGVVGPRARAELLSNAKAILCPSTFLEPFCGVQVEAMLSGTPVISSDWGAFAEINIHGRTGFRCRTFEQFTWAVEHVDAISPVTCYTRGLNFSMEKVAKLYTDYLDTVADIFGGEGWYQAHPDRLEIVKAA